MIRSSLLFPIVSLALLTTSSFASAQEDSAAAPPATQTRLASYAVAGATWQCVVGAHDGISDADARTATNLVCGEISKEGGGVPATTYRVDLGRLGSAVIFSVAAEAQDGTIQDQRQLQLASIEEVAVATPRLVEALLQRTSVRETEKVDNLVGEDTRNPKERGGRAHVSLGLLGVAPIGESLSMAPGLLAGLNYESKSIAAVGSIRFASGSKNDTAGTRGYFALDLGVRYFLSETDFSPYVSGGLSYLYFDVSSPNFEASGNGLGAFGEVGFQVLRTHRAHLGLGLRLDAPLFSLKSSATDSYDSTTGQYATLPGSSRYVAPLSLAATLTF